MNPSCTQERKFIELKRVPINVTPNQEMKKQAKLRNTPTSFTHIVIHIMQGISLTDTQEPPQLTSLMVTSSNGAPRNSPKPLKSVQMHKQEKFTQECWIKTGSETSLDQLVIP